MEFLFLNVESHLFDPGYHDLPIYSTVRAEALSLTPPALALGCSDAAPTGVRSPGKATTRNVRGVVRRGCSTALKASPSVPFRFPPGTAHQPLVENLRMIDWVIEAIATFDNRNRVRFFSWFLQPESCMSQVTQWKREKISSEIFKAIWRLLPRRDWNSDFLNNNGFNDQYKSYRGK